jgi:hypothetical protein
MIVVLKRSEATPSSYPAAPSGLSVAAAALDSDMIWARIEAYTAYRWTNREVTWTVEGPGGWAPDLTPATITASEKFISGAWVTVALDPEWSGGFYLPGCGPFRFTANVGSGTVPPSVMEAFRRLAEYMADDPGRVGSSSFTDKIGPLDESVTRTPTWLARAMQYSGAGDLLRPYRKA